MDKDINSFLDTGDARDGYLRERLTAIWRRPPPELVLTPLRGDASTRRYYRLAAAGGNGHVLPLIIMRLDAPAPGAPNDFVLMTGFLRGLNLPAPEIFYYDAARGLVFLEDCGDLLLQDAVTANPDPERTRRWYCAAVDLLADMQWRATRHIREDCPAWGRRFDVEKLMWEYSFMLTHFVVGLRQTRLTDGELESLRQCFLPLCETLAAQPLYFTHRDFHSRNLMAQGDALRVIDYQDARMGPCQYDLASLLRDSYIELDGDCVEEMIERFIRAQERNEGKTVDRAGFRRIFDWMAVQRNLKAVGTFAYQKMSRGTDRYLADIPRTLGYVSATLRRDGSLAPLRERLGRYIPELR